MMNALESPSTRPYLIRALFEWCTDNGLTQYLAVMVDDTVQVPREYVQNGEIVLNISYDATSGLKLGNEFVEFKARFAGVPRDIMVPMDRVIAIYARENGQGMAFPLSVPSAEDDAEVAADPVPPTAEDASADASRGGIQLVPTPPSEGEADPDPAPSGPDRPRPALKRIK